ncbi:MAG: hypothetical protein LBJ47_03425, partial [Tannerella sp.]|nr:hypothetical protein [Tannerella sp.]
KVSVFLKTEAKQTRKSSVLKKTEAKQTVKTFPVITRKEKSVKNAGLHILFFHTQVRQQQITGNIRACRPVGDAIIYLRSLVRNVFRRTFPVCGGLFRYFSVAMRQKDSKVRQSGMYSNRGS